MSDFYGVVIYRGHENGRARLDTGSREIRVDAYCPIDISPGELVTVHRKGGRKASIHRYEKDELAQAASSEA